MTDPYYQDERVTLLHGDCLDVLATLPDASVDSVVTDPPYGLEFMGKEWDAPWKAGADVHAEARTRRAAEVTPTGQAHSTSAGPYLAAGVNKYAAGLPFQQWCQLWATECLRVLKPGGHLLAFGGTRTWHRLAVAIEDAGFELRDSIAWLYGSGFPKSLDVSKAIDKAAGAEREVVGTQLLRGTAASSSAHIGNLAGGTGVGAKRSIDITAPATPDAERWQGWGTALKPGHEPVVVARKPACQAAILDTIGSQLGALEEACRRRVSGAARSSARTRADSSAARTATAPASAATQHGAGQEPTTATGAAAGSSAATATSASEWTAERFLSTVTSWRECLAEISAATSTSTTSTATSRTTDLQTLSSCLSSIMQSVTAQSTLDPRSWSSLATAADNLFAAGVLSSRSTLALSAIESATSATPEGCPPAAGSPAFEPVVVARKPLAGTVAQNVLTHGTGALNIDGCRVGDGGGTTKGNPPKGESNGIYGNGINGACEIVDLGKGRWPANVILDESQAAALDQVSGMSESRIGKPRGAASGNGWGMTATGAEYADTGGASRFFYVAKAPTSERPRYNKSVLRLRAGLTPEQVGHVRARLAEAGVRVD